MEFQIGEIDTPTVYPALAEMKLKPKPKPRPKQSLTTYDPCNCVSFARWKTGVNTGSIGVARNHPVNSQIPKVGAIVVMGGKYPAGHLAVVTDVADETISIIEANATPCQVGSRTLKKTNEIIIGYYIP